MERGNLTHCCAAGCRRFILLPLLLPGKKLMNLSANAQATLLLTSDFSRAAASEYKPLVVMSEWGKFVIMAEAPTYSSRRASGAATARETYRLEQCRISQERILGLLAHVVIIIALAVDQVSNTPVYGSLTRGDVDFRSLEKTDCEQSPPVLFGCGNKALLQAEGRLWRLLAREMLRLTICAIPNNWPRNWPNRGFALSLVVREVLMNVQ